MEKGSVTKSQEERKPTLRGKWESVFSGRHTDNAPGNSGRGQGPNERSSFPAPNSKAKTDGKEGNKDGSSDKRSQILCRYFFFLKKKRHVNLGIFPCVRVTSLKKDTFLATNAIFDMQGPVALFKESTQMGCVVYLNILIRENLFYVNQEN